MKIVLEIPDWVNDQRLTILAGMELVARKNPWDDYWQVKKIRCNNCGECCLAVGSDGPFGSDDEGKCTKLYFEDNKWLCGAKYNKPYRCLGDPLKSNVPSCNIKYDFIKQE